MRTALLLLGMLLVACGDSGQEPTGGGGAGNPDSGGPPGDGGSTTTSMPTAEERLEVELSPWVDQLVGAPFGTAAAISASNGEATVTLARGTLFDGGPDATAETKLNVASVSKLLTAARGVRMAGDGALSLDDTLSALLPGVTVLDGGGIDRTDDITVRMLLGHTSGLPKVPADLEVQVNGQWSSPDLLQTITAEWTLELAQEPGTYLYSNFGYALLGAIIERIDSCTFSDCMAPELQALGMTGSTFWPADLDEDAAHGRVEPSPGDVEFHAPAWYGSRYALPFTGLWASMPDLRTFGEALLAASSDPEAALFPMTQGQGHALGIIHDQRLGTPSLEHDGSTAGFYAWLIVLPEKDVVLAVAVNGGNEASEEIELFSDVVAGALDGTDF